jgi:hypothetical protein
MSRHGPRVGWPLALVLATSLLPGCRPSDGGDAGTTPLPADHPGIVFEPKTLDLGLLVPGGRASGHVLIRNVTDHVVTLVEMTNPCECTAAALDLPQDLEAGATLDVEVQLDLQEVPRGGLPQTDVPGPERLRRQIELRVGAITTLLKVRAQLSDRVVIAPTNLSFGSIVEGESVNAVVMLYPGRELEAIAVLAAEPSDPLLRVDEVSLDDGSVRLDVVWGPLEGFETRESSIKIVTDAEDFPVEVRLLATLVGPVRVTPATIPVAHARPNQPVSQRLEIATRDGRPFRILEVSATDGRIQHRPVRKSSRGVRLLDVVVLVPHLPETVQGELIIRTDVPGGEVLTIPVHVSEQPS